jgi:DNA-directed RNA polymerase subunit M/transcription elongation factor TFIIS
MKCPNCDNLEVEFNVKQRRFDCSKCGYNRELTHTEINMVATEREEAKYKKRTGRNYKDDFPE